MSKRKAKVRKKQGPGRKKSRAKHMLKRRSKRASKKPNKVRSEAAKRAWAKRKREAKKRSKAARQGWQTRRAHTHVKPKWASEKPEYAQNLPKVNRAVDLIVKDKGNVRKILNDLAPELSAQVIDEYFEKIAEAEGWTESDETKILNLVWAWERLDPQDIDMHIRDIAEEYDWTIHDVYELWQYGESAA